MNRLTKLLPIALLTLSANTTFAELPTSVDAVDPRIDLQFTAAERIELLAEMRAMLGSIQGILLGIANGDRTAIADAARISGNQMARATPAAVRAKLPQAFKDLGGPTHLAFEEVAIRAETDEMDALARLTGELMNQCMACHAAFRVR